MSRAPVPSAIPDTGFGGAAAECATSPGIGVDYHALVWEKKISSEERQAFTQALLDAGFVRRNGDSGTFEAPAGAQYSDGTRTRPMRAVVLEQTSRTHQLEAMTILLWT